ncbi:MAG: hypothetical protein AAF235_03945 [Planctomycetota bacterium]
MQQFLPSAFGAAVVASSAVLIASAAGPAQAAAAATPVAPISAIASEYSQPSGNVGWGFMDFETDTSRGVVFRAAEGGRLDSVELVMSDVSGFIPEEARTDIEIRVYAWDNGVLGELLAFREIPHEDIPDHPTQFSNWTWDAFAFASEGLHVTLEPGNAYAVVCSLRVPPTVFNFGRPTMLGNSSDPSVLFAGGELFERRSDGSIVFLGGISALPPQGSPGIADVFHRINVSRSSLPTDADQSGAVDFFDTLDFLTRFDAGQLEADYDLSTSLDAADIRLFVTQTVFEQTAAP